MKKHLTLMLVSALILSAVPCGSSSDAKNDTSAENSTTAPEETTIPAETDGLPETDMDEFELKINTSTARGSAGR